jgi:urease accessory protein
VSTTVSTATSASTLRRCFHFWRRQTRSPSLKNELRGMVLNLSRSSTELRSDAVAGEVFSVYPIPQVSRRAHEGVTVAVAAVAALLLGSSAEAHMGTGLDGGVASGFNHPFIGFDHLLAMVSVGLWGAFLGRPLIYALPVIFPAVMVGGAVLGMLDVPWPPVEIGIELSMLVLGGCIALSVKAPIWAASLIVATFALFHGYAHGRELPSAADPIGYSVGFVFATGLLHVLGICVGFLNDRPGGVIATRSMGGVIGGIGVWCLYKGIGP